MTDFIYYRTGAGTIISGKQSLAMGKSLAFPDGATKTILANCNPDFKIQFTTTDDGAAGHQVIYGPTGGGMTAHLSDVAKQAMTPEQDFCLATRLAVRRMLGCTSDEAINLVGDPHEYFEDGTFTPEQAAAEIIAEAASDGV
jgi:hypothetical protein